MFMPEKFIILAAALFQTCWLARGILLQRTRRLSTGQHPIYKCWIHLQIRILSKIQYRIVLEGLEIHQLSSR